LNDSSPKIANEYSIQLRQYALTADAYTFWTNLKKNTESLGSIFDAQPSEISGNIHSATHPSEPVVGYISVGGVAIKRIFITEQQLPAFGPPFPNEGNPANCTLLEACCYYVYIPQGSFGSPGAPINQVNEYINYDKGATVAFLPVAPIQVPGGPVLGYTAITPKCADCTLQKGATNKQPAYWKF
jgi:hypothetical protein